ncbi:MAG: hypothetical protein MUC40_00645 [Akkermansiaceae bacterium]|jgi:hypothetical protein|nr:hypothetical protein [Akkermansiaceae bacterium]
MTQTDVANLAIAKIGESMISDIDDTGDKVARVAKLHYAPVLKEILRGHFWGFAMASAELVRNYEPHAKAVISPGGADNDFTLSAVASGSAGDSITFAHDIGSGGSIAVAVVGSAITVTSPRSTLVLSGMGGTYGALGNGTLAETGTSNGKPEWNESGTEPTSLIYWDGTRWRIMSKVGASSTTRWRGTIGAAWPWTPQTWTPADTDPLYYNGTPVVAAATTLADLIAAIEANAGADALVTATPSGATTGNIPVIEATALSTTIDVVAPGWDAVFALPDDFLKLRRVTTADGAKIEKFDFRRINGSRHLVMGDYDSPWLEYVAYVEDPDAYDPLFLDAFTTLLASRMARSITGSEANEAELRQMYEAVALPSARAANSQDTRSNENHPLRELLDGSLTGTRGDFLPDPFEDD